MSIAPDPGSGQPAGPPKWPEPSEQPTPPPSAGGSGVHPLTLGRALGVGWSLYRFRWAALLAAGAIFLVPAYAVSVVVNVAYGEAFTRWQEAAGRELARPLPRLQDIPLPLEAIAMSLLGAAILAVATTLASAALIHLIAWTYGGGRPAAGQAIGRTIARLPSLLGAMLVATLVVTGMLFGGALLVGLVAAAGGAGLTVFLALIVAVSVVAALIFVTARWSLFPQALMLDGVGARAALGRSWRLVSGSTWRVLGYLLTLFALVFAIGLLAGLVAGLLFGMGIDWQTFQPVWDARATAGQVIAAGVVVWLAQPLASAVMTLLYYDLRLNQGETLSAPAD